MAFARTTVFILLVASLSADIADAPAQRGHATIRFDGPAYDLRSRIAWGVRAKAWAPAVACGQPTRKGLPCRRRVAGGGPCYQHRGAGS